jgi:RNA polymerase sigma-70 factor (family 1)
MMSGISESEFDQIFNSLYDPIRNFIYYKCGDIASAEDIAQDTFLKIWEKKAEIKKETVKQLLYTIANNMFLNKVERQKISFRFTETLPKAVYAEAPDYEYEVKEFGQKLQKALAGLDENKRTVFLMNRIDGYTYNEIAINLGLSVKAIEKRMEKALAFLRKKIDMNI